MGIVLLVYTIHHDRPYGKNRSTLKVYIQEIATVNATTQKIS